MIAKALKWVSQGMPAWIAVDCSELEDEANGFKGWRWRRSWRSEMKVDGG
jgi:hypothetical protein